MQVQHTEGQKAHPAGQGDLVRQGSSLDGSQDSYKENGGYVPGTDAKSHAPGTKGVPALDFTHSPLIQGIGNAAVPALHLHQARYADMFGDDAEDEDAIVPDTERGVRWSLRTPPKCEEFHRGVSTTHVAPLVLPQQGTPASGAQRRSNAARSIHATSPSPLPRTARVSPSPIHVLPQGPLAESSTPNMGTCSAAAGPARGATGHQQCAQGRPERLSVRTPFVEALRRMRDPNPPSTPTFAAQRPTRPAAFERWDVQSVLEALTELRQQCYESYSCCLYNMSTAVIPWQTLVLLAVAVGWALVSTWCAFAPLSTVACIAVVPTCGVATPCLI